MMASPITNVEKLTSTNVDSADSSLSESQDTDKRDAEDSVLTEQIESPQHQPTNAPLEPLSKKFVDEMSRTSTITSSSQNGKHNSGNWGWFEDVHSAGNGDDASSKLGKLKTKKGGLLNILSLDAFISSNENNESSMAVTAPTYVLEDSRSSQNLWKVTAGNRPVQPVEERAYYEKVWAANFSNSQAKYNMPMEVLTASSPFFLSPFADRFLDNTGTDDYDLAAPFNPNVTTRIPDGDEKNHDGDQNKTVEVKEAEADAAEATLIHGILRSAGTTNRNNHNFKATGPHLHIHTYVNQKIKGDGTPGNELTVLVRGDNVFGTTVSKSFMRKDKTGRTEAVSVSISVGSYRVVQSKKEGKYAQYLVIYCEGNFRETVGVWKRFADFSTLSKKIMSGHESCAIHPLAVDEEHDHEWLPNAITSWRLLKKRQKWYRCLDAGYLSLKIFLLERFLHDILFESSSSQILRDFVGVDSVSQ